MRSQAQVISVRGQKIFCWKLGRGCHFGSNGPIYIFNFIFLFFAVYFCIKIFIFIYLYLFFHWQRSTNIRIPQHYSTIIT